MHRIMLAFLAALLVVACGSEQPAEAVTPVPTYTKTPEIVGVAAATSEPVYVPTQQPLQTGAIDRETAGQVLSMLIAQQAAVAGLQDLAGQQGDMDLSILLGPGAFAAVARDAATEEYPPAVAAHIDAVRSNAAALDTLLSEWADGAIEPAQVTARLADINVGADIAAFGDALRAAGYTDDDLTQIVDELQKNLGEQAP